MKKVSYILFNYLPVLYAFLLPFGGTISVLVVVWFIVSLFCIEKEKFRAGIHNEWFWILVSFFALHVLSAFISDNKNGGLRMIELSSGFLGFPYFFFLFSIQPETIKKILISFINGCFFALLACLGRATWFYFHDGVNYFYYNDFSYFMHAGYFSMYLLFSSVITFFLYSKLFWVDSWTNYIRFFYIILFSIGIFLCASKIGLIAYIVVVILVLIIKFKRGLNFKKAVIFLLTAVILFFSVFKIFPIPFVRLASAMNTVLSGNIDKTSGESTAVRMLIWKESIEIMRRDIVWGVGVGDVNDELSAAYVQKGLTGASEHNLNAHNQYLQTFIGLGIIGFTILLISTMGVVIYGFIRKNRILLLFGIIVVLNFLVESMLQAQAGNLFFVFFLCLLLKNEWLDKGEFTQ